MADISIHAVHKVESSASFQSSVSDWAEPTNDLGIKLQPGTLVYGISVNDLHPTQLCVGMQQVHEKMNKLQKKQAKGPDALDKFLCSHPVPVVLGPEGRHYLIDHHHLTRAMYELGIKSCYAGTVLDLSELTPEQFWVAMGKRNLLWCFAPDGERVEPQQLPKLLPETVAGLADDPYRSLAALVRKAGGYTKSTKPFSEFVWANYLRARIPIMQGSDVETFVHQGLSEAMHLDAAALPGYTPLDKADTQRLDLMRSLGKTDNNEEPPSSQAAGKSLPAGGVGAGAGADTNTTGAVAASNDNDS